MEFVMIVEPDEVGRKRLEAVFQTEKPSFSYQITGRPEEALDILEHQKTDVLVCETSRTQWKRIFHHGKNDLAGYGPCGNDECRACKRHPLFSE